MAGRLLAALTRSSRAIGGLGALATGVGAVGTIMGARNAREAILSDSEEARLRALEARRREGQLGLTDKQRMLAEQQTMAPIRSLAGDISRQTRDAGMSQEGGFGAAVSKGLAEQGQLSQDLAQGQAQVQQLDEQRRMQNRAELDELRGKRDAEKLAKKNRFWDTLSTVAGAGSTIAQQVGPGLSAAKEREIADQMAVAQMYGDIPDDTQAFLMDY
jgi:hypothetical protein